MRSFRLISLVVLTAVVGCGGEDTPGTPDGGGGPADGGSPDAEPEGACLAGLVDLDEEGQHDGNRITYFGNVGPGPGEMAPEPGCTGANTENEVVHHVTITERSRVRASTNNFGTGSFDTIVYVRTECDVASSEIACNDDFGGLASEVLIDEVTAGTELYVVVDSYDGQALPLAYELTVTQEEILGEGETCDPTQQQNICDTGLVCSIATGAPVCDQPLGPPTVTGGGGQFAENHRHLTVQFEGSDPDGDIMSVLLSILDADAMPLDLNGDGAPDEFDVTGNLPDPLPGNLTVSGTMTFLGFDAVNDSPRFQFVRWRLVDSAGDSSVNFDAPILHPEFLGPGDTCGTGNPVCQGELTCTAMTCEIPAAATAACAAADAGTPITASGTYPVTIAAGAPDNLEGTCWWEQGHGETILTVDVTVASRLTARTDAAPSANDLDTYVYLRTDCDDPTTELGCNDDINPAGDFRSILSVEVQPGSYYLVIDGSSDDGLTPSGDIGVQVDLVELVGLGEPCTPEIGGLSNCASPNICGDPTGGTNYTCMAEDSYVTGMCAAATPLVSGVSVSGSIAFEKFSAFEGNCAFAQGLGETLYTLVLAERSDVVLSTDNGATTADTVVYVLDTCSQTGAELGCHDDVAAGSNPPNYHSSLSATLDPGTYTVLVDLSSTSAWDGSGAAPNPAPFQLDVTITPNP
jgi:hypothetical protein